MSATQTEKETKEVELFNRIQNGEKFNENYDGSFGVKLGTLLQDAGFKHYETRSRCKVASYENNLEFQGSRVHIVVSNLLGNFTQVSVT